MVCGAENGRQCGGNCSWLLRRKGLSGWSGSASATIGDAASSGQRRWHAVENGLYVVVIMERHGLCRRRRMNCDGVSGKAKSEGGTAATGERPRARERQVVGGVVLHESSWCCCSGAGRYGSQINNALARSRADLKPWFPRPKHTPPLMRIVLHAGSHGRHSAALPYRIFFSQKMSHHAPLGLNPCAEPTCHRPSSFQNPLGQDP